MVSRTASNASARATYIASHPRTVSRRRHARRSSSRRPNRSPGQAARRLCRSGVTAGTRRQNRYLAEPPSWERICHTGVQSTAAPAVDRTVPWQKDASRAESAKERFCRGESLRAVLVALSASQTGPLHRAGSLHNAGSFNPGITLLEHGQLAREKTSTCRPRRSRSDDDAPWAPRAHHARGRRGRGPGARHGHRLRRSRGTRRRRRTLEHRHHGFRRRRRHDPGHPPRRHARRPARAARRGPDRTIGGAAVPASSCSWPSPSSARN